MIAFNSDEIRNKMKSKYLANPDYNYEKVNRASLACGPMVKWAIAQVSFRQDSSIVGKVLHVTVVKALKMLHENKGSDRNMMKL